MANAENFKLFFLDANDYEIKAPITDIHSASDLILKGKELYDLGKVSNSNDTTRTSLIHEIKFSKDALFIL